MKASLIPRRLLQVACGALALAAFTSHAAYSSAVLSLNPVAYWPLNETVAPGPGVTAAVDIGSLGTTFNAAYQGNVTPGVPGALAGEPAATATGFDGETAQAQTPYTAAALANYPSFTIEAWVLSRNPSGTQCVLCDVDPDSPRSGWLIYIGALNAGQYNFRAYAQNGTATSLSLGIGAAGSITANQWYHLAVVVNNQGTVTNVYAYLNGVLVAGPTVLPAFVASDGLVGGFTVGARSDGGFRFNGAVQEVAYYTTALSAATIAAHYAAGTSTSPPTPYEQLVEQGNPILYLRLGEPNNLPVANNLGTVGAAANGYYQAGSVPGVAGPSFFGLPTGFGANDFACQFSPAGTESSDNPGPGVACAPYDLPALDDETSITLSGWVKVPAANVGWFTCVMGRGDSSYRFGLDTSALPRFADGGGGNGDIVGSAAVNDGNWHLWTGVYNSTNGSAALYIDTALAGSTTWNPPGGNLVNEFFIGGAPDYGNRNFVGEVCQVAIFTNALTPAQIQQLYYAAAPSPYAQAVASLNPLGYWPLGETTQPPFPQYIQAINLGTLGTMANANYVGDIVYGVPGIFSGGSDSADSFNGTTSELSLPYQSALSLNPPFSVEAWVQLYDVPCYANPGGVLACIDATTGGREGWLIYENGNNFNLRIGNSSGYTFNQLGSTTLSPGVWYHVAATFDGSTATLYVNGNVDATGPVSGYTPNQTQPFEVGAAAYFPRFTPMAAEEVALYTSLLPAATVLAHYQAGTNGTPLAVYANMVESLNPILYYQLNEAAPYTAYPGGLPVAANLGSLGTNGNGFYQPLTYPGAVPGPTNGGFGPTQILACQLSPGAVQSSSQSGPGVFLAPYDQRALNSPAVTLAAWIQAPLTSAEWFQTPIGRGDHSYRLDIDTSGDPHFAANPNGDIVGPTSLVDDTWHFWAGVFDPSTDTSYLYIDGLLAAQAAGSALQNYTAYLLVGGAPDYLNRNFVGNVCQVALYNKALSASQVTALYDAAGVPPGVALPTTAITLDQGVNGSLTASVAGTAPLSYQWYYINPTLNTTNIVTGDTSPTLNLTNAQPTMSGYEYFLAVTNLYGTAVGPELTLTVVQGPPILNVDIAPLTAYVPAGVSLPYSVQVSGTAPFSYQWFTNGTAALNATNPTYNLLVPPGTTTLKATIKNSVGSTNSSTASAITGIPPILTFNNGSGWTETNQNVSTAPFNNNVLTLTDGSGSEARAAFFNAWEYIGGFVAFFTYQEAPGSSPLADGTTFCVQNCPTGVNALGLAGGDFGYSFISPSAAFEMNLYSGANGGSGIQFGTNGLTADSTPNVAPYYAPGSVSLTSGDPINVTIYYDGSLMHLWMADTTAGTSYNTTYAFGSLPVSFGSPAGYVGFTGATGGENSIQTISSFSFSYTTPPVLSVAETAAGVVVSWPISVATQFVLQESSAVTGPWANVSSSVVNGQNQITVNPALAAHMFYRLRLQ